MRLKLAGLPAVKTLDGFDFAFQPSLDEARDPRTASAALLGQRPNVIFLGPPGCGKTHLAASLGHAAITAGEMVHFTTARELFAKLRSRAVPTRNSGGLAQIEQSCSLSTKLATSHLDHLAATHFFRLVCERYERGSIILTSNKRFSEWGELIGDETLAAAILDRLLHHATTFSINGPSYRLKEKRRAGTYGDAGTKENDIT